MNVKINNENGNSDMLTLPRYNWQKAIKEEHLTRSAICLYLFFANHKDQERVALDRKTFEEATGNKRTAYYNAVRALKAKGYLIQVSENNYNFYTVPQRVDGKVPEYLFGENEKC